MVDVPVKQEYPIRHPYQVLRRLPKGATPAQQDSAIQATFQPAEIRYSERPDTLRLPGQPIGKSYKDFSLPLYYKETYFKNDSLYHPEINGGRMGIPGDPVPYQPSGDNVISLLLIFCFLITVQVVPRSIRFIMVQLKDLFYNMREDSVELKETAGEVNYQLFLCLQAGLLLSLTFFFYSEEKISETYILQSEYALMGVFFLVLLGYFGIKELLYSWVCTTFFTGRQRKHMAVSRLFLVAMEGVLMLPSVFVYVYFGLSVMWLVDYTIVVVLLIKLLSFYKSYSIFFRKNGNYLQNFLYFCTLEITPLAMLWGILNLVAESLKVVY